MNKDYAYADENHKHAVTELVVTDENNNQTTNTYRYDENGNMTCRIEGGETFLQAYNAENRMSGVLLVNGDCDTLGDTLKAWQFTYDGDGVKVKQEYTDSIGTLTIFYYAGGSYEVQTDGTTETVRQYYAIARVTAGMREDTTFYYFLTDHLGSVVGVTDSTGVIVSETRYLPFGEVRTDVGTISQTDYGYTFQRNVAQMGLMDYKARYYSTLLGRFTQPDTIIPGTGNPQTWNRYSYTTNNPINYIDPSGHKATIDEGGSCNEGYKACLEIKKNNDPIQIKLTPSPIKSPTATPSTPTPTSIGQYKTSTPSATSILSPAATASPTWFSNNDTPTPLATPTTKILQPTNTPGGGLNEILGFDPEEVGNTTFQQFNLLNVGYNAYSPGDILTAAELAMPILIPEIVVIRIVLTIVVTSINIYSIMPNDDVPPGYYLQYKQGE